MDKQTDQLDLDSCFWFKDIHQANEDFLILENEYPSNSQIVQNQNQQSINPLKAQQIIEKSLQLIDLIKEEPFTKDEQQQEMQNYQFSFKRQLHRGTQEKLPKEQKQSQYSKAYRQRKKQQYKILQEQNIFLKKRITQLQSLLRQKQIELNRFKFPPPQKELTLQQFQKQFIEVSVTALKEKEVKPVEYSKKVLAPQDPTYHIFQDSFNKRGFAGSQKMRILNYHFNEILQGMLKDSQRYLTLVFINSKSWQVLEPLKDYELINNAFLEVFKPNEQDLKNRLKYFVKNLFPLHLQYNKCCAAFYKDFQKILECSQRIHNFIRQTYLSNMDVALKRLELETWFEFHKYGKLMRKLRFQWLDLLKETKTDDEDEGKKPSKGTKRKKLQTQQK